MISARHFTLALAMTVAAWEAAAQQLRLEQRFTVPKVLPHRVAFSPDGRWLLVSGMTGRANAPSATNLELTDVKRMLVLVDRPSRKVRKEFIKNQPIFDVFGSSPIAFSADGRRATAIQEGAILQWDVQSGRRVASWGTGLDEVALSPDGRVALARSTDYTGGVTQHSYEAFELATGRSIGVFTDTGPSARMLPVDTMRLYLLVLRDGRLGLRNLRTGEERVVPDVSISDIVEADAALSADGRLLALGLKPGSVSVWALPELRKNRERAGLTGAPHHLALAPDGAALAFSMKQDVCVWSFGNDGLACSTSDYPMGVGHLEFSPDSRTVASTGTMIGVSIALWHVPERAVGPGNTAVLRFDGLYENPEAGAAGSGYLRFYEDGTVLYVPSTGTPQEVARWLHTDHANVGRGTFRLADGRVAFEITAEEGRVEFEGTIGVESLDLQWFSRINDRRGASAFRFVPLERLKGREQ